MGITQKDTLEGLFKRLTGPFGERGFTLLKTRKRFWKPKSEFVPIIGFTVLSRSEQSVLIRPQMAIRVEAIENIINKLVPTASWVNPKHTVTMGEELGRIAGDAHRWEALLQSDKDLDAATSTVLEAFEKQAVPLFEKFNNLQAIDDHINGNPSEPAQLCRHTQHRSQAGIVLARLLKRQDIPELIKIYGDDLKRIRLSFYEDFEKFLVALDRAPV